MWSADSLLLTLRLATGSKLEYLLVDHSSNPQRTTTNTHSDLFVMPLSLLLLTLRLATGADLDFLLVDQPSNRQRTTTYPY